LVNSYLFEPDPGPVIEPEVYNAALPPEPLYMC
jgi:hypothetical protein